MVFNTGLYTDLPDNSILITANMQSETGFPSSHQLKSYVASKSHLKLAACAVLSADAGLLVVLVSSMIIQNVFVIFVIVFVVVNEKPCTRLSKICTSNIYLPCEMVRGFPFQRMT